MRVVLFSTYESGHQSFGVASASAWLRQAGASVEVHDLSLCAFEPSMVSGDPFVAFHVPMHTATRLAATVIPRVRDISPRSHVVVFGLYGPMNAEYLESLGADTVLGAEFERDLVSAWRGASGVENGRQEPTTRFVVPDRAGMPGLARHARLQPRGGPPRIAGYTEATRGCKHTCRHCPIVPVYGGRFVVVEPDVVLEDIAAQVAAGATHVTFGDPDFLNGPAHALRVVRRLHEEFSEVTYDVTIKVQHLRDHLGILEDLAATGCVLITSAVESFDEAILDRFDKRHDLADLEVALAELRRLGIGFNPTFVAFTPWTTIDGYLDLLTHVARLGLVGNVAPIQYAIRLLVPAGSLLFDLPGMADLVGPLDTTALVHPWRHPDPRMDLLAERVLSIVQDGGADDRGAIYRRVWAEARRSAGATSAHPIDPPLTEAVPIATVPFLTEPWYC